MEYINRKLEELRAKIALDRLNTIVPVPLSVNGATSGAILLPTVKAAAGAIQFTNADVTDTTANNLFRLREEDGLLITPGSILFGQQYNPSYIIFPDGTTQGTASINGGGGSTGATGANGTNGATGATGIQGNTGATGATGAITFTSNSTAPAGATYGDMWFNTTSGNVFVYITDGTSSYWIEPFGPQGVTGTNGASGTNGATGSNGTNGATGATGSQGIQGATGATGSQGVTGATGPVGDYVISFNGTTGAVTGASLGINTFNGLNTFNAGISASGATFSKDIKVNTMTVGLGKSSDTTNVAIGVGALASDTSDYDTEGVQNTAIGSQALTANTTGSSNVGVGHYALFTNTTGVENVGVGTNAFYTNTTGSSNVGVGTNALFQNTTGGSNVGVGSNALVLNTTGGNNVGVGASTLSYNTTGSNKTAIGWLAGAYRGTESDTNTTGTGGIYIGYRARGSTLAQTNEIVIGVDALGLGSNTAVIGATLQSAATIYGVLNLPSGLSASGATFTGNISAPNIVISVNGLTGAVESIVDYKRGWFLS